MYMILLENLQMEKVSTLPNFKKRTSNYSGSDRKENRKSLSNEVLDIVADSLFYVRSREALLDSKNCGIPSFFNFTGQFWDNSRRKYCRDFSGSGLQKQCERLQILLDQVWLQRPCFKEFKKAISELLLSLIKYRKYLKTQNSIDSSRHLETDIQRQRRIEENSQSCGLYWSFVVIKLVFGSYTGSEIFFKKLLDLKFFLVPEKILLFIIFFFRADLACRAARQICFLLRP